MAPHLDPADLERGLGHEALRSWAARLPLKERASLGRHAALSLARMNAPANAPGLQQALVTLRAKDTSPASRLEQLQRLAPWKKGPWLVHGTQIEAEWDCSKKWARVEALDLELEDKAILDVGAGNGFYLDKLVAARAQFALGLEPSVLYSYQFLATRPATPAMAPRSALLLGRLEELDADFPRFDVVFSMGVLYHVRSPIDHLLQLRERLQTHGQLILETLVIPGGPSESLTPYGRYANMRNVWFIPSVELLGIWLERTGFRVLDWGEPVPTTSDEQRSTAFSPGPSLAGALDAHDPRRTVEGFPAPTRLLVRAALREFREM